MAGNKPNLPPMPRGVKAKGDLLVYWSHYFNRYIAKSWPKGNGGDTPKRAASRASFKAAVQLIKNATPAEQAAAIDMTKNTLFLPRDVLMMAAYGTLMSAETIDGTVWKGFRIMNQELQTLLNSLGVAPGSLIYRDANGWSIITIGEANQVLTVDEDTLLPDWKDAQGGDGGGDVVTHTFMPGAGGVYGRYAAARGEWIVSQHDITVFELAAILTTVTGGVYRLGIAPFDPTTHVLLAAPVYTSNITVAAGQTDGCLSAALASPVAFAAGTAMAVFINRTDATAATEMDVNYGPSPTVSPGIYRDNAGDGIYLASLDPQVGDAWSSEGGTYCLSLTYALSS